MILKSIPNSSDPELLLLMVLPTMTTKKLTLKIYPIQDLTAKNILFESKMAKSISYS